MAAVLGLAFAAQAQTAALTDLTARSVYVQAGDARAGAESVTVGITLPWTWPHSALGGGVSGYWDLSASRWSVDDGRAGPGHYTVVGAKPVLRYRFADGRSPVFVEGGIGITYSDKRYQSVFEQFSTRYNFASHLGAGVNFGAAQQHELALRYEHVSNAGLKKPNPGENFTQLRYAYRF